MCRPDPANHGDNLNEEQELQDNRISSTKYEEIKNSCEKGTKKQKPGNKKANKTSNLSKQATIVYPKSKLINIMYI